MKYIGYIFGYAFLICFILGAIVFIPLGIIWAINYLLGFSIAYGFKSWLAVVILSLVIEGVRR